MYISLKSHHFPQIEATASVIGVMVIKSIKKCAHNSWKSSGRHEHDVDGGLVQHQLLERLDQRHFMVPGGKRETN